MKNLEKVIKKLNIKVYTLFIFMLISFPVFNSNSASSNISYAEFAVNENKDIDRILCLLSSCDVTDAEVENYLTGYGYTVNYIEYSGNGYDRIVTTQNPYKTMVYVEGGKIVGMEDIQY